MDSYGLIFVLKLHTQGDDCRSKEYKPKGKAFNEDSPGADDLKNTSNTEEDIN